MVTSFPMRDPRLIASGFLLLLVSGCGWDVFPPSNNQRTVVLPAESPNYTAVKETESTLKKDIAKAEELAAPVVEFKSQIEYASPESVTNIDEWFAWAKNQAEIAKQEFTRFSPVQRSFAIGQMKELNLATLAVGDSGYLTKIGIFKVLGPNRFLGGKEHHPFLVEGIATDTLPKMREYDQIRDYDISKQVLTVKEYVIYDTPQTGRNNLPLLIAVDGAEAAATWMAVLRPVEVESAIESLQQILAKGLPIEETIKQAGFSTPGEKQTLQALRDDFLRIKESFLRMDERLCQIEFREYRHASDFVGRFFKTE